MLHQIAAHTPAYVWGILAFLVYRGVAASRDRSVGLRSVFILPAVMLALGLQSTAGGFGLVSPAGAAWLAGLAAGIALAGRHSASGLAFDRAAGKVQLPGNWWPMALMMAVFAGKFAVAVALAAQPALRASLAFALPACAAFGMLSGAFMARPLRIAAALRAAPAAADARGAGLSLGHCDQAFRRQD